MSKLIVFFAVIFSAPARADIGDWSLNLQQGMAVPIDKSADTISESYHIQVRAEREMGPVLSLGFETGFSVSHRLGGRFRLLDLDTPKDGARDDVGFTSDASVWIMHMMPVVKLSGRDGGGNERFYGLMGIGMHRVFISAGTLRLSGATSAGADAAGRQEALKASAKSGLGFHAGLGTSFELGRYLDVGLEIRYRYLFGRTGKGLGEDAGQALIPMGSVTLSF